jgi:hypothetical protein
MAVGSMVFQLPKQEFHFRKHFSQVTIAVNVPLQITNILVNKCLLKECFRRKTFSSTNFRSYPSTTTMGRKYMQRYVFASECSTGHDFFYKIRPLFIWHILISGQYGPIYR